MTHPTTRDFLAARSHAVSLLQFPDYPPQPGQREKNKALLNTIALLDEWIVKRLTQRRRVDNERE